MNLQLKVNIKTEQLKNPIWYALISEHAFLSIGNDLARRYPADISPFFALADQSAQAYDALTQIINPGEALFTFLPEAPRPTAEWTVKTTFTLDQMAAFDVVPVGTTRHTVEALDDSAVPEMLELTQLTNPGPFKAHTNRMGNYFGIWHVDATADSQHRAQHVPQHLVAMAGERLNLEGFQEVSAVCTHPDFRGNGFAQALVSFEASKIVHNGKIPMLHVLADNHRAISVYQSLGFEKSNTLHFAILQRRC